MSSTTKHSPSCSSLPSSPQERLDKLAEIFDKVIMPEKVEAFWEHERFLKRRGWDPASTGDDEDDLIPLPPSQNKDGKDEFVQKHQAAREDTRLYQLHQLRLDEIEAAKRDGQERLEVHNRLRNVEPLRNRRKMFSEPMNGEAAAVVGVSAWDHLSWFDAAIIGLFCLILVSSILVKQKGKK